jgi:ABC-type multidrug transport system fused ATPase/permease subunit
MEVREKGHVGHVCREATPKHCSPPCGDRISNICMGTPCKQVAFPKLAGDLIDVAISQQEGGSTAAAQRRTNAILAQIIAVVVVGGVAGGLRSWLFQSAAERVMYLLRVRLFQSLMQQEVGFYDRVRTGEQLLGACLVYSDGSCHL